MVKRFYLLLTPQCSFVIRQDHICSLCARVSPFPSLKSSAGTQQMRGSRLYPGRKHCPLPDVIFWGEERQRQSRTGTSRLISARLPTFCGREEKPERRTNIPLNSQFCPMKVPYPSLTTRNLFYTCEICLTCKMRSMNGISVSTLCHRIVYQSDGQWPRFLWRFQPEAQLILLPANMCLTRQTSTPERIYGLDVDTPTNRAFCCLIHANIYHLQWFAWSATVGVNATLEIRGLITSWCKNRSTRACGFVQGQQWKNALVEQMQPFGLLLWPCKNNTADILQAFCSRAELRALVCSPRPWLVLIWSTRQAQSKNAQARLSPVVQPHLF